MRLIDAIKVKASPFEIPDCSRDDLPQFFVDMGYRAGAEIGVDKGEFSEKLCQARLPDGQAGLELYSIDPWQRSSDYGNPDSNKWFDEAYGIAHTRLAKYPNCTMVKKTSMEAVKDFADESLDFVYIDANHQLKYIVEDLVEWTKRVKKGGIVAGHDYIRTDPRTQAGICHVFYALHAFTQAYKIDPWYILGKKDRRPDEVRDRFRSWMFIKP